MFDDIEYMIGRDEASHGLGEIDGGETAEPWVPERRDEGREPLPPIAEQLRVVPTERCPSCGFTRNVNEPCGKCGAMRGSN
jgi:hypothetical protein